MPNLRWADKAQDELDEELVSGAITQTEYSKAMAELRREINAQYEEEREEAGRNVDRDWDR